MNPVARYIDQLTERQQQRNTLRLRFGSAVKSPAGEEPERGNNRSGNNNGN